MAAPPAATDQRARAAERTVCSEASGLGRGIGSCLVASRPLLDRQDEYRHPAKQQIDPRLHLRQLAEVALAELQIELTDTLLDLLIGRVEPQLLLVFPELR